MQRGEDAVGAVKHMKKSGALWVVLFAFAAGIIMLIIGSVFNVDDTDEGAGDGSYIYTKESFEEYKASLNLSISAACKKLSGSEVQVFLDFSSSGQAIYAQNTNTGSDGDRREEYVIVGSGANEGALYLGEKFPELSGIGVVCQSNLSQSTRDEISAFLSATYGLPLTRIYVL